ncbi:MAG TPA: hypothetical protein VIL36_04845 [Acidimicrobiales bacterium]
MIIDGGPHPGAGDEDTTFLDGGHEAAMATPPMAGAFEALAQLVERFEGRVWLVSKCGERIEARTRAWLAHHRFHERTGIPADHVRFCRRRPDKAVHCRELAITDFVDDRPDVLGYLEGVVERRYLFGPQDDTGGTDTGSTDTGAETGDGVVRTPDWPAVLAAIAAADADAAGTG